MSEPLWINKFYYCNPFEKKNHSSKKKKMRNVLSWMCEKLLKSTLKLGRKICDQCRNEVALLPLQTDSSEEDAAKTGPSSTCQHGELSDEISYQHDDALSTFNKSLECTGESPVKKRKLKQKIYPWEKLNKTSCGKGTINANNII